MNLVGKIFTVLICVMSVCFAGLTVTLHATHTNWKEVAEKHKANHATEQAKNETLDEENTRLEGEQQKERAAYAAVSAAQRAELTRLQGLYDDQLTQISDYSLKTQKALDAMKAAEDSAELLRTQTETLVATQLAAQQEHDNLFNTVVMLTDDLHVSVNDVKRLRRLQTGLTEQLSKAQEVLRMFGLVAEPGRYPDPPMIDGLVLSVPSNDVVTISLGSDDGLVNGHYLDIFRTASGTSTYVGRIQVVKTQFDKSVCKVAQLKSPVRTGDNITTRLQNYKYVTVKLHQ